jgi:predicted RNA-binding Zn ribbon-like protein
MTAPHPHPKAAPGELDHVRELVNTFDLETGEEQLAEPAELSAWLADRGLLPSDDAGELTAADVARAQQLREALRKILLAHNGFPLDSASVEAFNAVAADTQLVLRYGEDGTAQLVPVRGGIDVALGRLCAIVFRAQADGTWQRLKACGDHACEWAFYDHSKNRSGTWCDMAVCGNRAKARAYRERTRGSSR